MKLYVDDIGIAPDGWQVARTYGEAIDLLSKFEFEEISLDHDLGCFENNKEFTGYDVLMWLVERKLDGKFVPNKVHVHTMNPVGMSKMLFTVKRYWECG